LIHDANSVVRIHFLAAATRVGLLGELVEPATRDSLVERLDIERGEQFDLLLSLGVSLGELTKRKNRYRLRGSRAKALAGANGTVWHAAIEELVSYHGSVYQNLPERLRGAPLGDYLPGTAAVVANSSLVLEPLLASYVSDIVERIPRPRVLDVGCGSGFYLRAAGLANKDATGLGIDMQQPCVDLTARNLNHWGIADRFRVARSDIRTDLTRLAGPYDVAFLLNNVYYFDHPQRLDLFRALRATLADGATLVVCSLFHGANTLTLDFDVVLTSTVGCHPLPALDLVLTELADAGFRISPPDRLAPGHQLFAVRAVADSAHANTDGTA
jgi:SAM-dependent methyltransferase